MRLNNSITDIKGIKVGHAQDFDALTGCSVILCERGAVAGISQRGGAPGTRETDLLQPAHLVERVHAILLAGGSAFGLDAAAGVMKFLEEMSIGFDTGDACVPIVPAAILYDLSLGKSTERPDKEMGYQACKNASSNNSKQGNIGAGTGASVGKIFGINHAMKAGIGTASLEIGSGVIIGAFTAVNAFGDIVNYKNREIIAGARRLKKWSDPIISNNFFADTLEIMKSQIGKIVLNFSTKKNTIIGVIATNARLNKEEAIKFADAASNGIALTVQPSFTMLDGDAVFSLSTGEKKIDINILCGFAPFVFADAIINAVMEAEPLGGLPSAKNIK